MISQTRRQRRTVTRAQLPNDQLEQLELVEHLAVQMQHLDTGPLHAGPRGQAEIQTVLERTPADGHAASELRAGDGRESVLPVQHRVPSASGLRRGAGYEATLDLGAGQGGITVPAVQRHGLAIEILLRHGRAPGARHGLVEGRAHRPFLRLRYPDADALRLGAGRRHARHPHLHLRALLARPFGAHPRARTPRQQDRRRVTPLETFVQGDPVLGIALPRVLVASPLSGRLARRVR